MLKIDVGVLLQRSLRPKPEVTGIPHPLPATLYSLQRSLRPKPEVTPRMFGCSMSDPKLQRSLRPKPEVTTAPITLGPADLTPLQRSLRPKPEVTRLPLGARGSACSASTEPQAEA